MFKRVESKISRPPFVVDPTSIVRDTGRQVDWPNVDESYQHGSVAVAATAQADSSATQISVTALEKAIRAGTMLVFLTGSTASAAFVTEDAAVGDTVIKVEALDETVANNSVANYGGNGGRFIPAGTVMDLLPSGKLVPSAQGTGGVTAYCVLETNADEDAREDASTGYGAICAGFLYENLLPEANAGTINSDWKTELRARGGAWQFAQYEDNTVS